MFSMMLSNAIPNSGFNTPNAAVFLGMHFSNGANDLTYWPPLGTTTNIVFDDPVNPVVDDGIGVESNTKTGNMTQCGSGYTYSRWPNLGNNNAFELTAFRSGSRSVSRFAGSVRSCSEIGGDLLGPDRNPANTWDVPRVDARFAGCTVTAGNTAPRPCTGAEVTALNNTAKTQRVLDAQFSMLRMPSNFTCGGVLATAFPTYP
jgi:hypothetical protein